MSRKIEGCAMRFGRRSRNPFSWKKHTKSTGNENETEFNPVASEERDALLSGNQPEDLDVEEASEAPAYDAPEGSYPIDPTQRLLTALGRFQRQVARAREGQPQEMWAEECMSHLIAAVEIALEQGWRELVNALTETARILQSYEDAGRANQAASFLGDSNELLCLMVGDLIVGRIRPGVVEKWRQRYERALRELEEAGIPLVTDEEEPRATEAPRAQVAPSEEQSFDEDVVGVSPLGQELDIAAVASADSYPDRSYDHAAAVSHEEVGEEKEDIAEVVGDLDELDRAVESLIENLSGGAERVDLEEVSGAVSGTVDLSSTAAVGTEQPDREVSGRRGVPDDVAAVLDGFCDDLAQLAENPSGDVEDLAQRLEEDLNSLRKLAHARYWDALIAPCDRMVDIVKGIANRELEADDRFFDLAYAFCGLYGESSGGPAGSESITTWLKEYDDFVATYAATIEDQQEGEVVAEVTSSELKQETAVPVVEVAESEPDFSAGGGVSEPAVEELAPSLESSSLERGEGTREDRGELQAEDTPESLLATAQQAFANGNVAQAKRLALEAALRLAAAQVKEAEGLVARAEERLKKDVAEAEQARRKVQIAEQAVAEAEQRVAGAANEWNSVQERAEHISQSVTGIQKEIEEIEEKIRALEAQRNEALRRKAQAESELREARSEASTVEQHLGLRRQEEMDARSRLEEARQQVKTLERKRLEDDALLEKTREVLNRRRISLEEIRETIAQIGNTESTEIETGNDLLF
ncbi:MAG TPA: hypothetical protein PLN86_07155 [Candidatus Hydrogenedentes bacterium]|nr:hypothetical protein [Candidatus Hydrogenedentota bacterium]